jgi:class 3 adenylate cyclase
MSGPSPTPGSVTFLFSDIEDSTDLIRRLGDDVFAGVRAERRRVLRAAFEAHGGREIDTATTITSDGKRKRPNAERGGDQRRDRAKNFTGQPA